MAGPTTQGFSWYVTFPPKSGDVSSLIVSTGNGAASVLGSVLASAGTLSGTDPFVTVTEFQKGGVQTSMVTPEEGLEPGTAYAVRVKSYNGIGWSEVSATPGTFEIVAEGNRGELLSVFQEPKPRTTWARRDNEGSHPCTHRPWG